MASIKAVHFGSVFLSTKVCCRLASSSNSRPLLNINFGIFNTGSRTYSKYPVSRNGLFNVFQCKPSYSYYPRINLVSSVTTKFSETPVFPQSNIKMYASTAANTSANDSSKVSKNLQKGQDESKEKLEQEAPSATSDSSTQPKPELSRKEKLKQAVRDYGATVIVFHVTMSLMSLGFFYLLVQSGLDVVSILSKIGISESVLQSKVTEEAGKFVFAYAVHKVFAPLRITITLTATPFIVRKLRGMGILKQMASKTKTQ